MVLKMTRATEIIVGVVAVMLVAGDIYLHAMKIPADGLDTWTAVVVTFFFTGNVIGAALKAQTDATSTSSDSTTSAADTSTASQASTDGPSVDTPQSAAVAAAPTPAGAPLDATTASTAAAAAPAVTGAKS